MFDKLKSMTIIRAIEGKNTILSRLSLKAFFKFSYFRPYRKTPSIKMATVAVVLPSMCNGMEIYSGILVLVKDNMMPNRIEIISGFLESFFATIFNPVLNAVFFSLYSSRIVIDVVTLMIDIVDAERVAKDSPSLGNANMTKGMPKNARLPKTVLRVSKYKASLENLSVRYRRI